MILYYKMVKYSDILRDLLTLMQLMRVCGEAVLLEYFFSKK